MNSYKKITSILLLIFILGCAPQNLTVDDRQETVEPTVNRPPSTVTSTPQTTPTLVTATETESPASTSVSITAETGNLYIRRGPSTKYNRIGVLTKGMSAEVIGQDVLSNWVQIKIPDSDNLGWVSIQTNFHRIDGDLSQIPDFTFPDFPVAAYIKNCTEHILLVEPGEIYLENLFTNAQGLNEARLDSGIYSVYDATLPELKLIQTIDVQEGETVYITINGLGKSHKCP